MAMKKGLDSRAQRKAFEAIFAKFDHNKNGKLYLSDYYEELRLHDIEIDDEEKAKIESYAKDNGQVWITIEGPSDFAFHQGTLLFWHLTNRYVKAGV